MKDFTSKQQNIARLLVNNPDDINYQDVDKLCGWMIEMNKTQEIIQKSSLPQDTKAFGERLLTVVFDSADGYITHVVDTKARNENLDYGLLEGYLQKIQSNWEMYRLAFDTKPRPASNNYADFDAEWTSTYSTQEEKPKAPDGSEDSFEKIAEDMFSANSFDDFLNLFKTDSN
ncbi:MAG: hypothetical protein ACRCXZ_02690 [Patescibacteria group bacterium]